MKTVNSISELKSILESYRKRGLTIGLVPTMGALHDGHVSLVKQCVSANDISVVSIFVNPTQFNNPADLETYPRTLQADRELLSSSGVDLIFAPSEGEMYPDVDTRVFNYAPLDTVMEGKYRAGHFNGVCQIVSKLFSSVNPDRAYFGEKDFQQLAIIRRMSQDLFPNLEVIACPIIREVNGLALSSRNMRLTAEQRKQALVISQLLLSTKEEVQLKNLQEVLTTVREGIGEAEGLELEYFEIVDGYTLKPVTSWSASDYIVGCIAVYCGDVRLIDNITYKRA